MKYLKQVVIILLFTFLGEVLAAVIPFPIPAAIYGIVLMLIALGTGLLKSDHVKEVSSFLISIMPVLFVPPAVRILEYWGIIGPSIAAIAIISVSTTFLVFAVSGLVTQFIIKKKGGEDNG
jgi:holin-like protein